MDHPPDRSNSPPADHRALVQQLFLRHSNSIRGFLLAFTPNLADIDDLLQTVFVTVTEKAESFEPGTNFPAWARAVARIELLRRLRERSTRPQTLDPDVVESLVAEVPELDTGNERLVALAGCIEQLSPRVRRAVEMRYREAHKPGEIARLMSLAKESVYVMLSRARAALRKCVERRTGSQEVGG